MTAGRPEGLRSRQPSRPPRDEALEFPRTRAGAMSAHRDRRLKVATALLGASLALGLYWMYDFYAVSSAPGEPVGDYTGLVIDANAGVVVGANVTVEGTNTSAETDANGTFVLHNVTSGRTTITIRHPRYVTASFTVFAAPSSPGTLPPIVDRFQLDAGTGTQYTDVASQHDLVATACMAVFIIGNVLTAVGIVAVLGRRRYSHAMLGGVGAILSFGAIFGLFFGVIAMFLLMGAREEFEDRRSLFATDHDMPFPRGQMADAEAGPPPTEREVEPADGAEPIKEEPPAESGKQEGADEP